MIEFLRGWIINIITIVMFLVLLEILIPSGKIKKFVNLISGFVLMIALINPFLGLINKGIDLKELQFSDSNFLDKKEIGEKGKVLKDSQMKQIAEVYRKKIIGQLEECAKGIKGVADVKADVMINEDYKSENFGEIKRAYFTLVLEDKTEGVKPVKKIEKVEVKSDNSFRTQEQKKEVSGEIRSQIENKINQALGIPKDNIVITLQD